MAAPAETPKDIINKLNAEVNAVMAEPAIKKQRENIGGAPLIETPDAFGAEIGAETGKWKKSSNSPASR